MGLFFFLFLKTFWEKTRVQDLSPQSDCVIEFCIYWKREKSKRVVVVQYTRTYCLSENRWYGGELSCVIWAEVVISIVHLEGHYRETDHWFTFLLT